MHPNFIKTYLKASDDEKMDLLASIFEPLDSEFYDFLFNQLQHYEEDEFVLVEITKVLSLYSPTNKYRTTINLFFEIVNKSDDDLLQSHALQSLEHLDLTQQDYEKINDIKNTTANDDLKAVADMILLRKKS